jgi:Leucine-rich repeat (LRR) protein
VELHVQNNSIRVLPDELAALQQFKMLDVSCNNISELPPALGYVGSLNRAVLDGNPLRTIRQTIVTGPTSELKQYLR